MLRFRIAVFVLHGVPERGMEVGEQSFLVLRLVVELHSAERVLRDHVVELGVRDVRTILFCVPIDERRGQVYSYIHNKLL